MKMKLIALAIAGATIAPTVMAQTANPVTLYGRVWVMTESVKTTGTAVSQGSRIRVSDNSSLFGIRGTEDIGGGLKVFFQLETAFRPDSNNTTFANRNSGVGMTGDFGSFVMGRWDTPFKSAAIAIDPFGANTLASYTGIMQDRGNFDRREQDTVQYWSPNMNGFQVRAGYAANEAKTAAVNPSSLSFSGTYTKGPFYVGYAWERHKDQFKTYQAALGNVANASEKGQALFGNATLGAWKLGLLTEKFKKKTGAATSVTDIKSTMFAVTYTAGKNQFVYTYQRSKDGNLTTAAVQPECKGNAVSYVYNYSRRTSFIGQIDQVNNNSQGQCGFGNNNLTIAADQDPRGITAGLRHTF